MNNSDVRGLFKGSSASLGTITNDNGDTKLNATEFPKETYHETPIEECDHKDEFIVKSTWHPEALQFGYRTKKVGFNDHIRCWDHRLNVKDPKEDPEKIRSQTITYDSINKERHRFAYGNKSEVSDFSKLSVYEKLIVNDPRDPEYLYPKKRVGYSQAGWFNGYEREKIDS